VSDVPGLVRAKVHESKKGGRGISWIRLEVVLELNRAFKEQVVSEDVLKDVYHA